MLYVLASAGFLKESQRGFERSGRELPVDFGPCPDRWERLEEAVRQGSCPLPSIEGEEDGGDFFSAVVPLLFDLHWPMAQHFGRSRSPFSGTVLDLGAGSAVWSLGVLQSSPEARALAVDRSRVLEQVTQPVVEELGLLQRYDFLAGDYHRLALRRGGYGLIFLGHLLHSDGAEASLELLSRCRAALAPGGTVVVAEILASSPRSLDHEANLFDLNMLMFTQRGQVFSANALEALGRQAGFSRVAWHSGPSRYPLLLLGD